MVLSPTTIEVKVELEIAITDELLRTKSSKFSSLPALLDDWLLLDDHLDETLLLDNATGSGVAPFVGFVLIAGEMVQMILRNRKG
jgi:hypothetical protein